MRCLALWFLLLPAVTLSQRIIEYGPIGNLTVNDEPFVAAPDQVISGQVVRKDGSLDGRITPRTYILIKFDALSEEIKNEYPEKIEMEIEVNYDDTALAPPYRVHLQRRSTIFVSHGDSSSLMVTQIIWATDKKSFLLSVEFQSLMHSLGYPADRSEPFKLHGQLFNIAVQVPKWISAKL